MATLTLSKEHATVVQVGGHLFYLWEGDDGGLYVETPDREGITVTISDDGDEEIVASGMWLTVQPQKDQEDQCTVK